MLPWQQEAITEVTSHAAQVAASTQAAIVHLRENRNYLFVPEYTDHLTTIADRSEDMKQTVDKFLDYGTALEKLQRLQRSWSWLVPKPERPFRLVGNRTAF